MLQNLGNGVKSAGSGSLRASKTAAGDRLINKALKSFGMLAMRIKASSSAMPLATKSERSGPAARNLYVTEYPLHGTPELFIIRTEVMNNSET